MRRSKTPGYADANSADSGWVGAGPDDDLDECLATVEEPFDERLPHVVTALGAIEPEALGVTLIAAWDRPLVRSGENPGKVLLELERLYDAGVRTIIDLASAASAERLADLGWVSARAPVHIVVGAVSAHVPVAEGVTAPRVGVLTRALDPGSDHLESNRGELPVFVRVESLEQIARLLSRTGWEGSELAHWSFVAGSAPGDLRAWDTVLTLGARLVFVVSAGNDQTMTTDARVLRDLVDRGYGDRLLLGYDADPIPVMQDFPLRLMEAGLSAIAVRRILVDNPAQALVRHRNEH